MRILAFLIFFCPLLLNAEGVLDLSLEECERVALANSPVIKQAEAARSAADSAHKAAKASYYPSLYFDATGGWVSDIPELDILNMNLAFGDNWAYSVGPTAEYLLFDYGGRSGAAKSAAAQAAAAEEELAAAKRTVLLNIRQAYFTLQQDIERLNFLSGQLAVATKQFNDVNSAFKAGAKSRLDVVMAQKQRLKAETGVANARAALGAHARELLRIAVIETQIDLTYPSADDIKLDALSDTLTKFTKFKTYDFDYNAPQALAAGNMAEYYKYLADSYSSSLYPRVTLQGGAYAEYPNGPIKEHIFLGKVGAALRFPLYEGSKSRAGAAAQESLAEQSLYKKDDIVKTFSNIFYSAKSMLFALNEQQKSVENMVEASKEAAKLTYDAYNAGSVTFLEVDNANLNLLESKINLADIYVGQLNSLATMEYLGRELL